jgi:methionine-rich copper-binding protein CopC
MTCSQGHRGSATGVPIEGTGPAMGSPRPAVVSPTRSVRARARLAVLAGGLGLMAGAGSLVGPLAAPAGAHAKVDGSRPAAGETIEYLPDQVAIVLDAKPATLEGDPLAVYAPDGQRIDIGEPWVEDDHETVGIRLDPEAAGPAGEYEFVYRIVSNDNHLISGRIAFVTTKAGAPGAAGGAAASAGGATSSATGEAEPSQSEPSEAADDERPFMHGFRSDARPRVAAVVIILLLAAGVVRRALRKGDDDGAAGWASPPEPGPGSPSATSRTNPHAAAFHAGGTGSPPASPSPSGAGAAPGADRRRATGFAPGVAVPAGDDPAVRPGEPWSGPDVVPVSGGRAAGDGPTRLAGPQGPTGADALAPLGGERTPEVDDAILAAATSMRRTDRESRARVRGGRRDRADDAAPPAFSWAPWAPAADLRPITASDEGDEASGREATDEAPDPLARPDAATAGGRPPASQGGAAAWRGRGRHADEPATPPGGEGPGATSEFAEFWMEAESRFTSRVERAAARFTPPDGTPVTRDVPTEFFAGGGEPAATPDEAPAAPAAGPVAARPVAVAPAAGPVAAHSAAAHPAPARSAAGRPVAGGSAAAGRGVEASPAGPAGPAYPAAGRQAPAPAAAGPGGATADRVGPPMDEHTARRRSPAPWYRTGEHPVVPARSGEYPAVPPRTGEHTGVGGVEGLDSGAGAPPLPHRRPGAGAAVPDPTLPLPRRRPARGPAGDGTGPRALPSGGDRRPVPEPPAFLARSGEVPAVDQDHGDRTGEFASLAPGLPGPAGGFGPRSHEIPAVSWADDPLVAAYTGTDGTLSAGEGRRHRTDLTPSGDSSWNAADRAPTPQPGSAADGRARTDRPARR